MECIMKKIKLINIYFICSMYRYLNYVTTINRVMYVYIKEKFQIIEIIYQKKQLYYFFIIFLNKKNI